MADRLSGDVIIDGSLTVGGVVNFSSSANTPANSMDHEHVQVYRQTGTAATATVVLHECRGTAGAVVSFRAGSIVLNIGAATVTVDLKKNGVSILSAVITLDTANTARVSEAATLSSTAIAAGDVLETVVTATAGGGTLATGFWCELRLTEDYA